MDDILRNFNPATHAIICRECGQDLMAHDTEKHYTAMLHNALTEEKCECGQRVVDHGARKHSDLMFLKDCDETLIFQAVAMEAV